jgi:23S rRNA-/tRNA-specific pseudouridylate synthase
MKLPGNFRVAYEDEWLLVVDKPSGVPTQRTETGEPGLYEALLKGFPGLALHHRLDRGASGLVIFGKHTKANKGLTDGFRDHTIERTYFAVLDGEVKDVRWEKPLDGKPARTDVTAVGRGEGATAAEIRLHTGRTHQIRRHAALVGRPVLGDRRYGGEAGDRWPRLALHAGRLALKHPVTGKRLEVASPVPSDLRSLWLASGGTVRYAAE